MRESDILGPIDYLAVEFPAGRMTGAGFRMIHELVRRGILVVLDLEFVRKEDDGNLTRIPVEDVPQEHPVDVTPWVGMYSGLLDDEDIRAVGDAIGPGSLAGVLVYENAWAAPIMQEIEDSGARLLGSARIDPDDVLEALGPDATPEDRQS